MPFYVLNTQYGLHMRIDRDLVSLQQLGHDTADFRVRVKLDISIILQQLSRPTHFR